LLLQTHCNVGSVAADEILVWRQAVAHHLTRVDSGAQFDRHAPGTIEPPIQRCERDVHLQCRAHSAECVVLM